MKSFNITQQEIRERIAELMSVIPHCGTRSEAEEIQAEIEELEDQISETKAS